ncbi:unnamed protein product, partial [Ixodes pacificus]
QLACRQLLGKGRLLPLGGDPFLLPGPPNHLGRRRVGDAQLLARQPQVLQGHRLPGHPRRGTIHHGLHKAHPVLVDYVDDGAQLAPLLPLGQVGHPPDLHVCAGTTHHAPQSLRDTNEKA